MLSETYIGQTYLKHMAAYLYTKTYIKTREDVPSDMSAL